ncbi:hypothetical protein CPB84DRAFT_1783952 [Gymnopilus junonius]|uniref:Uncharacterized protein n=1 Tax=Gymnopilus junonius TaxID=109634 RepID=A0A9P5NHA5_GYMJU|nr:hypothetical protein CPB84DRAFT_1783952 [Gymnopilus junonius]
MNITPSDHKAFPPLESPNADTERAIAEDRREVSTFVTIQPNIFYTAAMPNLFPYALAAVSPTWEAYWTRLVLFIGADSTPVEQAQRYIEWSCGLPIDVFILNKNPGGRWSPNRMGEKETLSAFIQLLQPHMERCRSFHIEVFMHSSLPTLDFISDRATLLRSLYMLPIIGNLDDWDMETEVDQVQTDSVTMTIDGRTFLQALNNPPPWFTYQQQLRHLHIEGFSATLAHISTKMNRTLVSLSLSRLPFKIDTKALEADSYTLENLNYLSLKSLQPSGISELFRLTHLPELMILKFQHCFGIQSDIFQHIDTNVPVLIFHGYGTDSLELSPPPFSDDFDAYARSASPGQAPHADMIPLLSGWEGYILCLTNSQTPFDLLIEAFSTTTEAEAEDGTGAVMCSSMQKLILERCPSPSFGVVKKMIETRNRRVNYDDPDWKTQDYDAPAILTLAFDKCEPRWTTEEIKWVKERVVEFDWT